ncbi:MAG: MarR family transcriptional regulator [Clostridiales bacterium]|nr:MarR family transcriptional regulator [Clostridiales bacterium]
MERKIIHQVIHYAKKHRTVMQSYLDETGVYQAQHRLLMIISRRPNLSQIKLAEVMEVSTATIAVSLKKLEKAGLITKTMDETDNRLNRIVITDIGNQVVEQSKQIFQSTEKKIFEGFTEEEKSTLSELMERLHTNLSEMSV